jgi:hypothetical protein
MEGPTRVGHLARWPGIAERAPVSDQGLGRLRPPPPNFGFPNPPGFAYGTGKLVTFTDWTIATTMTWTSSWPNASRIPHFVGRTFPSHRARPSLSLEGLHGVAKRDLGPGPKALRSHPRAPQRTLGEKRRPAGVFLTPALVQFPWRRGLLESRPGRTGVHSPTLSIIWMLSLALFALHQVQFWAKKRPLAISIGAWLLYVALFYLRTVP